MKEVAGKGDVGPTSVLAWPSIVVSPSRSLHLFNVPPIDAGFQPGELRDLLGASAVQGLGSDGKPGEVDYQDSLFSGPHFLICKMWPAWRGGRRTTGDGGHQESGRSGRATEGRVWHS